jgi:mRNA interferase HicA
LKKRDLERQLRDLGWWFLRAGGSHDIWTNGTLKTPVPRHAEIKEMTSKGILDKAEKNPPIKK